MISCETRACLLASERHRYPQPSCLALNSVTNKHKKSKVPVITPASGESVEVLTLPKDLRRSPLWAPYLSSSDRNFAVLGERKHGCKSSTLFRMLLVQQPQQAQQSQRSSLPLDVSPSSSVFLEASDGRPPPASSMQPYARTASSGTPLESAGLNRKSGSRDLLLLGPHGTASNTEVKTFESVLSKKIFTPPPPPNGFYSAGSVNSARLDINHHIIGGKWLEGDAILTEEGIGRCVRFNGSKLEIVSQGGSSPSSSSSSPPLLLGGSVALCGKEKISLCTPGANQCGVVNSTTATTVVAPRSCSSSAADSDLENGNNWDDECSSSCAASATTAAAGGINCYRVGDENNAPLLPQSNNYNKSNKSVKVAKMNGIMSGCFRRSAAASSINENLSAIKENVKLGRKLEQDENACYTLSETRCCYSGEEDISAKKKFLQDSENTLIIQSKKRNFSGAASFFLPSQASSICCANYPWKVETSSGSPPTRSKELIPIVADSFGIAQPEMLWAKTVATPTTLGGNTHRGICALPRRTDLEHSRKIEECNRAHGHNTDNRLSATTTTKMSTSAAAVGATAASSSSSSCRSIPLRRGRKFLESTAPPRGMDEEGSCPYTLHYNLSLPCGQVSWREDNDDDEDGGNDDDFAEVIQDEQRPARQKLHCSTERLYRELVKSPYEKLKTSKEMSRVRSTPVMQKASMLLEGKSQTSEGQAQLAVLLRTFRQRLLNFRQPLLRDEAAVAAVVYQCAKRYSPQFMHRLLRKLDNLRSLRLCRQPPRNAATFGFAAACDVRHGSEGSGAASQALKGPLPVLTVAEAPAKLGGAKFAQDLARQVAELVAIGEREKLQPVEGNGNEWERQLSTTRSNRAHAVVVHFSPHLLQTETGAVGKETTKVKDEYSIALATLAADGRALEFASFGGGSVVVFSRRPRTARFKLIFKSVPSERKQCCAGRVPLEEGSVVLVSSQAFTLSDDEIADLLTLMVSPCEAEATGDSALTTPASVLVEILTMAFRERKPDKTFAICGAWVQRNRNSPRNSPKFVI